MPLLTRDWNAAAAAQTGPAYPNTHAQRREIQNAIGTLTIADIYGPVGATTVIDVHHYRIDRQNAPDGFVNVCVQRNDVNAPSTVASVFVPEMALAPGPGGPAAPPHVARIRELERAVRRGLEESLASFQPGNPAQGVAARITRREVHGNFSA